MRTNLLRVYLLFVIALIPTVLNAQAWISPKGVGSISITYQNNYSDRHYFNTGDPWYVGGIRDQVFWFDFSYSLSDRIAFSAYIPYTQAKYSGDVPYLMDNGSIAQVDNGNYHGSFGDAGVRLRYGLYSKTLQITPFLEYGAPSHGYPYYGHALIGSRLAEFQIGTYMARTLNPWIPNTYVSGRYGFGIVQKVAGAQKTRHHFEVEGGYFFSDRLRAFGLMVAQRTNGGISTNLSVFDVADFVPSNTIWSHHSQTANDSIVDGGGGMAFTINNRFDIYGLISSTLHARNIHASNYNFSIGLSWGFGGSPQRPCHC